MMYNREALNTAVARGGVGTKAEDLIRVRQLIWLTFGLCFRSLFGARTNAPFLKESYAALWWIISAQLKAKKDTCALVLVSFCIRADLPASGTCGSIQHRSDR